MSSVMKSQSDLVAADQGYEPKEVVHKVSVPGLKSLHNKSISEIAEVLASVIKSKNNVVELRYRVGEFIELTSSSG